MIAWLQRRWARVRAAATGTDAYWHLAVDHQAFHAAMAPLLDAYIAGWTLDVGAGQLAWCVEIARRASRYVAADVTVTHPDLDIIFDVQRPWPFASASFDSLFCCSVLEHVREPWGTLDEFYRVLRPGGHVVLSVPFLYYLHGAPQDYFRFTPFGIRHLARRAGFEVLVCQPYGGLAHTLLNVPSLLVTSALWSPRFRELPQQITALCSGLAAALDRPDRSHVFAQNVNLVLRRPA